MLGILGGVGLFRRDQHLDQAIARLDSIRWLHRVSYHAWRIVHHLATDEASPAEDLSQVTEELDLD